jgi:tRNA threonylcarbamoyladenosine biosynthesis protein TsaE
MTYISKSTQETQAIAQELAKGHQSGGIFLLEGPMGAGKTTFTQGFAQGLGISEPIVSPTYILSRQYPLPDNKSGYFYHLDLYRLEKLSQIENLGIKEIFENPHNIVLIEWSEKLESLKPDIYTLIKITPISEETREIAILS